ncbi:putative activating signal cointegrator complex subunit 2 [Paratrimastix pyriformis]|uniref:Activating signal cointegrator complex subunit 2 n=1 Tax=Paratrimastix pyriformis TaxID=342808 RepID=A0ABQ8UNR8_9EUKA|nr:putative activating signal cointegrator complex subunit 2 [Paratrimastix pyriformis]
MALQTLIKLPPEFPSPEQIEPFDLPPFLPQDNYLADERAFVPQTNEAFCVWNESLSALLKMPPLLFWAQVVYDESVVPFLDSFLRFAARPEHGPLATEAQRALYEGVARVLLRLSDYREGGHSVMEESLWARVVTERGVFDAAKLLDACALYGAVMPALQPALVRLTRALPRLSGDMRQACSLAATVLGELMGTFVPVPPGEPVPGGARDGLLYLSDICGTLQAALHAYGPLGGMLADAGLVEAAVRLYERIAGWLRASAPALEREWLAWNGLLERIMQLVRVVVAKAHLEPIRLGRDDGQRLLLLLGRMADMAPLDAPAAPAAASPVPVGGRGPREAPPAGGALQRWACLGALEARHGWLADIEQAARAGKRMEMRRLQSALAKLRPAEPAAHPTGPSGAPAAVPAAAGGRLTGEQVEAMFRDVDPAIVRDTIRSCGSNPAQAVQTSPLVEGRRSIYADELEAGRLYHKHVPRGAPHVPFGHGNTTSWRSVPTKARALVVPLTPGRRCLGCGQMLTPFAHPSPSCSAPGAGAFAQLLDDHESRPAVAVADERPDLSEYLTAVVPWGVEAPVDPAARTDPARLLDPTMPQYWAHFDPLPAPPRATALAPGPAGGGAPAAGGLVRLVVSGGVGASVAKAPPGPQPLGQQPRPPNTTSHTSPHESPSRHGIVPDCAAPPGRGRRGRPGEADQYDDEYDDTLDEYARHKKHNRKSGADRKAQRGMLGLRT